MFCHIFQYLMTSRLWAEVCPWCHQRMGATEWHHCGCSGTEVWSGLGFPPDYCRRRVEHGFLGFQFSMVEWLNGRSSGVGGCGGGWWMASLATRFVFSSLNHCMFASCFCLEASMSVSLFLHNYSRCNQISCIVDVSSLLEGAEELGHLSLLLQSFGWRKKFP